MRLILQKKEGAFRLADVDEIHLELLRQAGDDASMTDSPEGRARLFPKPVSAKDELPEGELLEDWGEYVTGELDTQFASDVGTLLADLDAVELMNPGGEEAEYQLDVPLEHGQAWFSALNQARLMLDIRYKLHPDGGDFDPYEAEDLEGPEADERLGAYMRYEFYALVQEWLVRHTL